MANADATDNNAGAAANAATDTTTHTATGPTSHLAATTPPTAPTPGASHPSRGHYQWKE
jgi:hypothetical protein